jgi:hypothetical protein
MLSPYIPDPGVTADIQYTVNNLVPETIYMFQIIAHCMSAVTPGSGIYGDNMADDDCDILQYCT